MTIETIDFNLPGENSLDAALSVLGLSGLSMSELDLEDVRFSREILSSLADAASDAPVNFHRLDAAEMETLLRAGVQKALFVRETGDLLIQAIVLAESQVLLIPHHLWSMPLTEVTFH